jgi:hypothetical protein
MILTNNPELKFSDISDEEFREYLYIIDDEPIALQISNPVALHVSASGGHRLVDADGHSYYVAPGWIAIHFKVKEGKPAFAF